MASTTRGDGPSGFSLAESRTSSVSPSSAISVSMGLPASYGTRLSTTGRHRRRTLHHLRRRRLYRHLTLFATDCYALPVMSPELYRRARRAEAGADRAEDRRRLRLEFFRAVLAEGLESLKAMHVEGASGEESVRSHARMVDRLVQSLTKLMVVYDGVLSPFVQRVMQELLYTLWDLGLQIGHSLRSLEDCVAMARTDFP